MQNLYDNSHETLPHMTISEKRDAMGRAILDYTLHGTSAKLIVHSSMFDDDEMSVATLFRTETQMPQLERHALNLCRGRVLDVGAGAGCHSLALQTKGLDVVSIDISPLSTEARRLRGVNDARCTDVFSEDFAEKFDTVLLLMNGLGIAGTLAHLPRLLLRCKELLAEGGQILADSSDIAYVFQEEDGSYSFPEDTAYYGEVDYTMTCGTCRGNRFNWLYVDFPTLAHAAASCGLRAEKIIEGSHFEYLCRITRAEAHNAH